MARGDKKAKVIAFLKKNPNAKNADIAKACGCSIPNVSVVKRDLGLTGSRGRKNTSKKARKKVTKKTPVISTTPSGDVLEHLPSALEYVDSAEAMLELLDHVEAAGGIEAVRSVLQFHQRLSEAIE
jgi:hypothetical protein